jgi:hypothetical protein
MLGENHPFFGQAVDIRSGYTCTAITSGISISHIICHNVDNVGFYDFGILTGSCEKKRQDQYRDDNLTHKAYFLLDE